MTKLVRLAMLIAALSLSLSACGKKGKLEDPEGTRFPRDYPTS
jgi:predicted small lipoprotein YifL